LLEAPVVATRPGENVVGVTLGFGDDLWGHDHGRVEAGVAAALRALVDEGWRVRLLCMNDEDREGHAAVARALDPIGDAVSVEVADSPARYLQAVAECTVVVAERLHAMVLAAAAGTPFVALEYQPKCTDFVASVGWERWALRTDEVDAAVVCALVDDLARASARTRLAGSVDLLRARLVAEADGIRRAVAESA
jgi:polysaccharide pyruvyl transferase WcaK-like protein